MPDEILIERGLAWTRGAFLAGGRVRDFRLDLGGEGLRAGDVLHGRVARVASALGGAFVVLDGGGEAFLLARDAPGPLVEGERRAVQVVREAVEDKAPRVSARIELAGRALAWSPSRRGVIASSRLGAAERARLEALARALGDGYAIRTAARGAAADALAAEAASLQAQWREIAAGAPAPAPRGAAAMLQDGAAGAAVRIRLDDAEALGEARAWALRFAPDLAGRLTLEPPPLFERAGAEAEFEAALAVRVDLAGGGFLLIEQTAALTAIDVNAGDASERRDAMGLNLAAAREAARQLRLRGIGGLVVIDLLQANAPDAGPRVLQALREALADDPAPTQLSGMSAFGLVELSRRRRGPSLAERLLQRPAPGAGTALVAERAFARVRAEAAAAQGRALRLRAAPAVIERLRAAGPRLGRLDLAPEPGFAPERFEVEPA